MKNRKTMVFVLFAALAVIFAACNRDSGNNNDGGSQATPTSAPASASGDSGSGATDTATGDEAADTQIDAPVTTLRVLYSGPGVLPDTQMVIDAFNEALLRFMPNTQVDVEFAQATTYEERLRMILSANETLDIANLHSGDGNATNNLATMSRMGATTPLDAYLANRPEWFGLISDAIWGFARVDNVTHMVPINRDSVDRFVGLHMQAWLADEYMDVERVRELLMADNGMLTREVWELLTDYLRNLQAAGELRHGASPMTMRWLPERAVYNILGRDFVVRHDGDGVTVEHWFETEDAKMMFDYFDLWWNEGLTYQGVLTAENARALERLEDGHTLFMAGYHHYDPTYDGPTQQWNAEETASENWGFDVRAIPWARHWYSTPVNLQGLFITRTSQDPQMALDFLWYTFSDFDLQSIIAYGVEGEHYTRDPENHNYIQATVAEAEQARYRGQIWNTGNMLLPDPNSDSNDWVDYQREIMIGRALPTRLAAFQLDVDPISIQIERYNAVKGEYEWPLLAGATPNWEANHAEMISQMKTAGSDEILAEIQRQINDFIGR